MIDLDQSAAPVAAEALAGQVARLAPVTDDTVEWMRQEALAAPDCGVTAYREYQSGGW